MIGLPNAHVGGLPVEETLGFCGPALLLVAGTAWARLGTRVGRLRRRRRGPETGGGAGTRAETLIIRMAVPGDAPGLRRLAQLDSAPPPKQVPMLVAATETELLAAHPLDGGQTIANPFRRTEEVVAMLTARAQHLRTRPRGSHRHLRLPSYARQT